MMFLWNIFMGSWIARCTAAILLGLVAIKGYGFSQKLQGKAEVIEASKIEGTKLNAKAKANRDRVKSDDKYFELGMRRYSRD